MNDEMLNELKIVVERVVRPIRAAMDRKRQMREELLAHLVSTFEEEAEKLGDEQAGLAEAKRRFGDPSELSGQLQRTVPAWNRFCFLVEKLRWEPGESLLHFAGKQVLWTFLGYAASILILLPRILVTWRVSEIGTLVRILVVMEIASAAISFGSLVLVDRMARTVYGKGSERSLRKAGLYGLASLAALPMLTFFIYWSLPIDGSTRLFYLQLSCLLAPAVPVLFLLLCPPQAQHFRYEDEWAGLDIAE
jgi:ATP-dependent Clp protease ATP-binding subunit ClpC